MFYLHFVCSEFLISQCISHANCRNLKSLYKKSHVKNRVGLPSSKKRSRYKVLNFEVDFLKTEVFQIEQNGSQATIFQKVFFMMFFLPFLCIGFIIVTRTNISFDFVICVSGVGHVTLRASSSHFFQHISSYK